MRLLLQVRQHGACRMTMAILVTRSLTENKPNLSSVLNGKTTEISHKNRETDLHCWFDTKEAYDLFKSQRKSSHNASLSDVIDFAPSLMRPTIIEKVSNIYDQLKFAFNSATYSFYQCMSSI